MVKFLETLADNVFKHSYSMMQIKKKKKNGQILGLPRSTYTVNIYSIAGFNHVEMTYQCSFSFYLYWNIQKEMF